MTKVAKKEKVFVKQTKLENGTETRVKYIVSPSPTTNVKSGNEDSEHTISQKAVESGIFALLQLINIKDGEKKKGLFDDDPLEITLQVIPIKIPVTHRQEIRVCLPHPMAIPGSDVCLITTDVAKSSKENHEPTIAYYKSLLKQKKISGITEIVPIRQLRSEYVPYEMKGRFASLYDMYLVDGRLYGKVTKFLGSRFFKKNKDLIPVKINTKRVKQELEKALTKTVLSVHGRGDSYGVKIGYTNFSEKQIKDNINEITAALAKKFPGGLGNIRKLLIKTARSIAIPIYLSSTPANSVPVPVVKPNLPKAHQPVEGELSTMVGGHVTVLPSGELFLKKIYTEEDIEMGYGVKSPKVKPWEVMNDNDQDMEVGPVRAKKRKASAADADSSDDDDVEAAEDAYVRGIQRQPRQKQGKAQSKKENVTPKSRPAKAKKGVTPDDASVLSKKQKKLQRVSSGEEPNTPRDKKLQATPKFKPMKVKPELQSEAEQIAFSPKKLKATPQVKLVKIKPELQSGAFSPKKLKATPQFKLDPKSEKRAEDIGSSPKKLKATLKVKSMKVQPDPLSEKQAGDVESSHKKLKATPKVKQRNVRKDPEAEETRLQQMIMKLMASKQEDLNTSKDRPVKSKKKTARGRGEKSPRSTLEPSVAATDPQENTVVKSPSETKKLSKSKNKPMEKMTNKEAKTRKKSPVSSEGKVRPVRKIFPRYFANESQKLLA